LAGLRDEDGGVVPAGVGERADPSPSRILNPRIPSVAKTAVLWAAWLTACGVLGYGIIAPDAGMIIIGCLAVVASGFVLARRLQR
jgi:hypothetical protein